MKKLLLTIAVISLLSGRPENDELIQRLRQKLSEYAKTHPFVGMHLIFNQSKYTPGDTAFFAVNAYSEDFFPLKGKKIFGLSLIDGQGKLNQRIKFATTDGKTFNQLIIPAEAEPGPYQCVVYAEASGACLFYGELLIVEKNKLKIADNSLPQDVALFPEGGSIILGANNKVVVKSRFSGSHVIKNDRNEEVARTDVRKGGLSHFYFTPISGSHYYCQVEGRSEKYEIPGQLFSDGVALSVYPLDKGLVTIKLNAPGNSSFRGKQMYLTILNGRKISFTSVANLSDSGSFKVTIPQEELRDGLSQVTVFDEKGGVLSERAFYYNRSIINTSLKTDAREYGQRELVSEELTVSDNYGNPVSGTFSVSVFHKRLFSEGEDFPFRDAFYLLQLPGIQQSINSLGLSNSEWLAQVDDYLIFKNHKLISWSEVLNYKGDPSKKFLESNLKLKGKALFKNEGNEVPDSTTVITYLQNTMTGYETKVYKGNFDLTFLYDFYGEDDLFYLMESRGKDLAHGYIVLSDSVSPNAQLVKLNSIKEDSTDLYADHQFKRKMMDRSYTFFSSGEREKMKYIDPNEKYEDETSGADWKIDVQDYVVFHTMEDLIREVVPYLMVRKSKTQKAVRLLITYPEHNVKPKGEPLFIIDGVLTKDSNFFLGLNPVDLLTIKLINNPNKLGQWGALGRNGIVLVATKKSVANTLRTSSNSIKVFGLNKSLAYPVHDYSNANNKHIPDFRASLYWNPMIKLNQNGKAKFNFYTSDMTGQYCVRISGVTDKGQPFTTEEVFVVNRK